jgi:hypothetical protein
MRYPSGSPHVAADLCAAVDRRRDKLCPPRLPLLVAGQDVSDPQVQEDRDGVAGLVVDYRDAWLVRVGNPPGFMMIHELHSLTMHGFSSRTTVPPRTRD